MPDSLGWRANWGVVVPSTNTSVQPEFDEMRPRGVTNHIVRIWIPNDPVGSNDDFNRLMENIRLEWDNALLRVMTCNPDYLVMGMSSETFWGWTAAQPRSQETHDGADRCRRGHGLRRLPGGAPVLRRHQTHRRADALLAGGRRERYQVPGGLWI